MFHEPESSPPDCERGLVGGVIMTTVEWSSEALGKRKPMTCSVSLKFNQLMF